MTEDDIYNEWEDDDDYDANRDIINNALEATYWMDGDGETDTLSEEWEPLIEK